MCPCSWDKLESFIQSNPQLYKVCVLPKPPNSLLVRSTESLKLFLRSDTDSLQCIIHSSLLIQRSDVCSIWCFVAAKRPVYGWIKELRDSDHLRRVHWYFSTSAFYTYSDPTVLFQTLKVRNVQCLLWFKNKQKKFWSKFQPFLTLTNQNMFTQPSHLKVFNAGHVGWNFTVMENDQTVWKPVSAI